VTATRLRRRRDAPLVGERAVTRGRNATEGGDERGGVKRAVIRSKSSLAHGSARRRSRTERPRGETIRPGTRRARSSDGHMLTWEGQNTVLLRFYLPVREVPCSV